MEYRKVSETAIKWRLSDHRVRYYPNQNELPMIQMVAKYVNERLEQYLRVLNQR